MALISRDTSEYPKSNPYNVSWYDYLPCAQKCLLSEEYGYQIGTQRCNRKDGACCPAAKPDGIRHLDIWACVWDACDASTAQNTVEVFMRECAAWGYPFSESFTLSIPSTVEGDHFPVQYNYKDFGKGIRATRPYGDNTGMALMIICVAVLPAQEPTISGFYGWPTLLAWSLALIAAALSGWAPESKSFRASTRSRLARWLSWVPVSRQDVELLATLAVPVVAAADIKIRRQRVSFHRVFYYPHPSFVPASDGDDLAADILTIRAALVIVSHFTWSSALVCFAWLLGSGFSC